MSAKSFSNFPTELLLRNFQLPIYDDLLSSAFVCLSWKFAVIAMFLSHDDALMLLPQENFWNVKGRLLRKTRYCRIYNILTNRTLRIFLPELQGRWYSLSSHGWLLTVARDDQTHTIRRLNPITSVSVKLPPERNNSRIWKSPERNGIQEARDYEGLHQPRHPICKVLAIRPGKHGHKFSFCTTGNSAWIRINNFVGRCSNAVLYKGDTYPIDFYGYKSSETESFNPKRKQ